MVRDVKPLDLEPIKARERNARNSLHYPVETIRANYLNDVPMLIAEVETLREQQRLLKRVNEEALGARKRLAEFRATIDREASRYGVEVTAHQPGDRGLLE